MNNIKSKISKLLALSERAGTEAEAQAAMAAAQRLLAIHNLSLNEIESHEKPEDLQMDDSTPSDLRNTYWKDTVYCRIAELYFCKVFFRKRGNTRVYVITGRPSNIEIVKDMASYLINTAEDLGKKESQAQAQTLADEGITLNLKAWRASFKIGFSDRIASRVREQIEQAKSGGIKDDSGRGLILHPLYEREKKEIDLLYRSKGIKLGTSRRSCNIRSTSGFQAGQNAASNANLTSGTGIAKSNQARITA